MPTVLSGRARDSLVEFTNAYKRSPYATKTSDAIRIHAHCTAVIPKGGPPAPASPFIHPHLVRSSDEKGAITGFICNARRL